MKRVACSLAALSLALCACVPAARLKQDQADQARFNAQLQERDRNEKCSQTAMPGTPEHMACRLGASAAPSN